MDAFISWTEAHQSQILYCALLLGIGLPLFQLVGSTLLGVV